MGVGGREKRKETWRPKDTEGDRKRKGETEMGR